MSIVPVLPGLVSTHSTGFFFLPLSYNDSIVLFHHPLARFLSVMPLSKDPYNKVMLPNLFGLGNIWDVAVWQVSPSSSF